ncbi:biopolymer transporter ExbD [Sorangium sp. So ce260]|uniref:ExbD/TolR family protein n=1 Tax=Sorangium sp. So ce260 TaxID=3133291 RepID=UPI003F60376E
MASAGQSARSRRGGIIEGINVTPLVDITLVLLIIFIVTAKIVVSPAVPLDLPHASQSEQLQTVLSVVLPAEGPMQVDGTAIDDAALRERAAAALSRDPQLRAVIQADRVVSHGRVMTVLDTLKAAGIARVAFGAVRPEAEPHAAERSGHHD